MIAGVERTRILELRSVWGTGGGPEKTILLGTAQTKANDFDITVCYLRARTDPAYCVDERARELGVKYREILERSSIDPLIWRDLVRVAKQARIELVHSHDYKSDLLAWLLGLSLGIVPLATAHGWTGHSLRERLIYYPLDKRLLTRFPRVIAVSSDIRADLIRHGAKPDRVVVVLNGIDTCSFKRDPKYRSAARRRFGIPEDMIAIGAVGRLEPQKRFDLLLEAFAVLKGRFPRATLLLAGEGSQRMELQRAIDRAGLGSSCRILGAIERVIDLHHALDLFVQSSDYEGTPNAVLEAMALETPIVATTAGGTAELLQCPGEALLVPTGNVQALADAMTRVLADPAGTATRTTAARRKVERELTFSSRLAKIESIYLDLLGKPRQLPT